MPLHKTESGERTPPDPRCDVCGRRESHCICDEEHAEAALKEWFEQEAAEDRARERWHKHE